MQRTAGRLRRSPAQGDEGFALLTVLGAMVVVTLFLFSSLAYALSNSAPSRRDQDAKAALAAAQAGIQEFASRLALDDTYHANNGGAHDNNDAFTQEVPVLGSGGAAASYTYELLTTTTFTGINGVIRLKVTGCSRPVKVAATALVPKPCQSAGGVTRDLVAEFRPDGFLRYIYLTDLEVGEPSLFTEWPVAEGTATQTSRWISGPGANRGTEVTWQATPGLLQTACRRYYYAGRHQTTYVEGQYVEKRQAKKYEGNPKTWQDDGQPTYLTKTASNTTPIFMNCPEVRFTGDDRISGRAHSNDAMQITGPVDFEEEEGVTSAWPSTAPALDTGRTFLPPPTGSAFWWGDTTLSLPGERPKQAEAMPLPISNLELKAVADPAQPNAVGCLYTGQTRIRFSGNKMRVLSPGTTSSSTPARCYNTGTPGVEQLLDIPPVVYVQDGACGTTGIGYPVTGEAQKSTYPWLPTVTYGCGRGHAFVSGSLAGRVTVATAQDIVITGDTTYQSGMSGSDALGLIPRGHAWIHHPVTDGGSTTCSPQPYCRFVNTTGVTPVRRIDAAVLSVAGSFLAQNWHLGAALSTDGPETGCAPENVQTMTCTKLTVRGSIIQKHRGGVGSPATTTPHVRPRAGYLKNYFYDERLLYSPPPYFLQPSDAWRLDKTMD